MTLKNSVKSVITAYGLIHAGAASAIEFSIGDAEGRIRTDISFGAAFRTEKPDPKLIGKLNLNPNLCGPSDCISFTGDASENQKLVDAPGAFFGANKDQGNLNYSQWDPVAAVTKLREELVVHWGDYSLKVGGLAYFDYVNYDFTDRHPDTTYQSASSPRNSAVSRQLGRDVLLTDAFVTGHFNAADHDFSVSAGYQHIRWGESMFIALNSLSQVNPPSAVLLHQPGTAISDVFRPTPSILVATQLADNLSLELLYELGWVRAEPDPGGSFFSSLNILKSDFADLSLGAFHVDPKRIGRLPAPGNLISETSLSIRVLDEDYARPSNAGQFGAKIAFNAENLNGGTAFEFVALNYHSQLPYVSVISTEESCMRESTSFATAFLACNGFIGLNLASGKEPLPLDTAKLFLDYPENIQMYGFSFNTNVGKWSMSGEYSVRPNMPLQVNVSDLFFAAIQPSFPKDDLPIGVDPTTIAQTVSSLPALIAGISTQNPEQILQMATGALNNLPAILGVVVGGTATIPSARAAAPDYISAYRGMTVGPNQVIRGYEKYTVDQLDITGLRAISASDNPFGADQILLLTEIGFTHIWGMPSLSRLQLEGGDSNGSHASPGADGTGNGGVADTRRLNPTQQTGGFATSFSWGYRILARFEYDNLIWGLNFKPWLMWGHDVSGIAPLPVQNFIAGTKQYVVGTEVEYGQHWAGQVFYQGSAGGGTVNTLSDRDVIGFAVSYAF